MGLDYFFEVFKNNSEKNFIVWGGKFYKYSWLTAQIQYWKDELHNNKINQGKVVVVEADFSPNSIALLLALIHIKTIIVPISHSVKTKKYEFIDVAQGEFIIQIDQDDNYSIKKLDNKSNHKLYNIINNNSDPGLVLFSSGSTGKSKASVHNLKYLLEKFEVKRHTLRTITFLLYDHIGGFNTLFYNLSNAGLIVTANERSPKAVLQKIEKYEVELLPTSPTFLNLILLSEEYKNYNLTSLKLITYGTEPMPQTTLDRIVKVFPGVKCTQTYGLSEVGILRSKSKNSNSLWVKVGGEGYKTRIVNGMLEIKSKSSMLGYLNAENPFTIDGWFKTGDAVKVDGEYIKILGRKSELINVGGEKVYPQEVEDVLLKYSKIKEATVFSEKNPIIGNIVCAKIVLKNRDDENKNTIKDIKDFCFANIARYKVPVRILISENSLHSSRFKKNRI